jgi:tRNA A58 N-methylase Trm61
MLAVMRGEEVNWKPWGELLDAVKTGGSPFEKVFGMDLFEYYETHPVSGAVFNEGMSITTQHDIPDILRNYDFSGGNTFVEIGGGLGNLLFSILKSQPCKNGILYDAPHVVKNASPLAIQFQVENRCRIVGGDFFTSVPEGGDVYLMKRILHDWSDELAIKILKNCHGAIASNGKIVVFETMIQDEFNDTVGKVNDVHMMTVTPGGKERTGKEFRKLFDAAGFALVKITQVGKGVYSNLYAIEGQKY